MYYVMDAHSFYNFIYFILLIIVSHTHTHMCIWLGDMVEINIIINKDIFRYLYLLE